MTPTWLDEGLAVMMEDQAYNGMKGGPWNNDLKTVNFQRDPSTEVATFGSSSMFGGVNGLTPFPPASRFILCRLTVLCRKIRFPFWKAREKRRTGISRRMPWCAFC